ncbi:MAG: YbaK/EbsC family protein [Caldilineaceae bacterium]|nr:YbaK/EbsC family protein [Caldilineaceae bacterium]
MNHPALTPDDLQQFVDDHQIDARLIRDIGETPTVPAAALALGVAEQQIVKTLLFLIKMAGADGETRPVVVISNGVTRVDKQPLAGHFGVGRKRVRLAPAEVVLELLGYPAGGVPPFGHRTQLPVIVDAAVVDAGVRFGGILYAGGGDDRTMLEVSDVELLRIVRGEILAVSDGTALE